MRRMVLEKLRLFFRREMGHAVSLGIVGMLFGLAVAPALGQGQTKPVIKIVATGGTIANTLDGLIPIQEVIADIWKNFPETHKLLDSVHFEVVDLIRVGSGQLTGDNFLEIARTVNRVIQEPNVKGVIVTQGTTTSEDTAFFLQLLVRSENLLW